jgi:F-type H+-transporting ATPase subunit alpha
MSNIDAVIDKLKQKMSDFQSQVDTNEVGTVATVADGIAQITGLSGVQASELLSFENGALGLALNLEEDTVGAIILGEYKNIREGEVVKRTKEILSIDVSDDIIGRVVDGLGRPVDGKGDLTKTSKVLVEKIAPGVMSRQPVDQPVQTGILSIDSMVPIGRGQRELIIGDRQTGKTAIAIDTILNQHDQDMICVYVAVGQKQSKIARIVNVLEERGAMKYTTIVSASAGDPASLLYLAPYVGVSIAEYFMDQGKDVLVIYDDLSKHAAAYREISLLLRRPPGREAYPGDVFYLHSRLLERACRRNKDHGGGSITALPIIETQGGDISGYIPTNVISITDGQIFLETNLFNKGLRPAVNAGFSVSRVGGSAQIKSMKKNAGTLKLSQAQFRELEAFAQFDSDLDPDTKAVIERGKRVTEILKQNEFSPIPVEEQVATIYAMNNGHFDAVDVANVREYNANLIEFLQTQKKEVLESLKKGWGDEEKENLKSAIEAFELTQK